MTFTCEKCGKEIMTAAKTIQNVREEECDISYCVCQHCGAKNLICVFDERMHELVAKRCDIEKKLQVGRQRRFSKTWLNKYLQDYKKVCADLKFRAELLKPIGLKYLKKIEKAEGEGNPSSGRTAVEKNNCCVVCGEVIPEGRQICVNCEREDKQ